MRKHAFLPLLLCTASPFAFAEPVEKITVVGSKLEQLALGAQTVFSQEQIDALQPASVTHLLKAIPHVAISENAKGAGQSFISIRGGESNFTLVMIDGVVVNDPTNSRGGGFDFNQLNVNAIERVEVYRGGASAIYGADAISGAINFITKTGGSSSVNLGFGENSYQNVGLTLSQDLTRHVSALLNYSKSEVDHGPFENYDNQQALLKLAANYDNFSHQLMASHSDKDSASFAEDSGGELFALPRAAELRNNKQSLIALNSSYQINSAYLRSAQGTLSWSSHKEDSNHPGIAPGVLQPIPASEITAEYTEYVVNMNLFGQLAHWQWVSGISAKKREGENTGFLDFGFPLPVNFELKHTDYSAFLEANSNFGKTKVNIGLRFEMPEEFDNDVSGRIAVSHNLSDDVELFVNYNEGFKLPSFFALAHPLIGNMDLQPEENQSYEIGFKAQFGEMLSTEINVFHNDFSNLVDFDPVQFTSVNRNNVETQGAEFLINHQMTSWLSAQFDLAYLETDIIDTQSELRRRPKWQGGIALMADFNDITSALYIDSKSSFIDSSNATGNRTLGGYTNIALNTAWQINSNTKVSLTVDNLLDKRYQESIGFFGTERQVRASVEYRLD